MKHFLFSKKTANNFLASMLAIALVACGGGGGGGNTNNDTNNNNSSSSGTTPSSSFTIGGMVIGESGPLKLSLNGNEPLMLTADGEFTFPTTVSKNGKYVITLISQPSGQICTVNNGSGADVIADVTNVQITCSSSTHTVGGTVSDLPSGQQVILLNNGTDSLTVAGGDNTAFRFNTPVAHNASYNVTVNTQPNGYFCEPTYSSYTGIASFNIITVLVMCVPDFTVSTISSADSALVESPAQMAIDSASNWYIADSTKHSIFKVTPTGVVTIFAGGGYNGSVDGQPVNGPLEVAQFDHPTGIAIDGKGIIYVSDFNSHVIRRITRTEVSTLAGIAHMSGYKDATTQNEVPTAKFNYPMGLAVNKAGTELYVADRDNYRIRKIQIDTSTGKATSVSTVAGDSNSEVADSNGQNVARFANPTSVTLDNSGTVLYVADRFTIRAINLTSQVVKTLPIEMGNSQNQPLNPQHMAVDKSGNLYVAISGSKSQILKITLPSPFPTSAVTYAYVAGGDPGSIDGIGSGAQFNAPMGVVVDPRSGAIYVGTFMSLRKLAP